MDDTATRQPSLGIGELMAVVLRLCVAAGWLIRHEIGELVGRSGSNLQNRTLAAMVTDGRLRMRYPARNHPGQAYAASEPSDGRDHAPR